MQLAMLSPETKRKLAVTVAAACLMAIGPILVTKSKVPVTDQQSGELKMERKYCAAVSNMLAEIFKLIISVALLGLFHFGLGRTRDPDAEPSSPLLHPKSHVEFALFGIPAIIYAVNNLLVFLILDAVDPVTFQLLSQLKTIFTGLLFRVFLQRRLSAIQYTALITLACGTATANIPNGDPRPSALWGLFLSVVSALLSSLGGIYSEKLLKDRKSASIHWQNMQLYAWGVVFNIMLASFKCGEQIATKGLLAGFAFWPWAVVVCNSLAGLAISAVLKFADNIARVYAHAVAMLATMLMCVWLFALPVTAQLLIGMTLVANSTFQYHKVWPPGTCPPLLLATSPSTVPLVRACAPCAGAVSAPRAHRGQGRRQAAGEGRPAFARGQGGGVRHRHAERRERRRRGDDGAGDGRRPRQARAHLRPRRQNTARRTGCEEGSARKRKHQLLRARLVRLCARRPLPSRGAPAPRPSRSLAARRPPSASAAGVASPHLSHDGIHDGIEVKNGSALAAAIKDGVSSRSQTRAPVTDILEEDI